MPANTATQGLTYPIQTDTFKELPAHLKVLADQLDARVNSHRSDLARSDRPPACLIATAIPRVYTMGGGGGADVITFDTVSLNIGGMTDLADDPRLITFPKAGFYVVGGYIRTGGLGTAQTMLNMLINDPGNSPFTHGFTGRDGGGAKAAGSGSFVARVSVPGSSTFMRLTTGGVSPSSQVSVDPIHTRMWAYWTADL